MLSAHRESAFRRMREATHRRDAAALIAMAAGAWLIMVLIVAAFLYGERKDALHRATANAEALVLTVEAHAARTFEAVDITLAGVAAALRREPEPPPHGAAFQEMLRSRLLALQPYARAIFVIGPGGRIVHDTDFPTTPDVRLNDREYFMAHREDPALERAIGRPLRSRSGFGWFLAATRRIDGASFRGVVVAALQPEYFELMYSRLLSGADSLMLYHRDGTLIARYPHQPDAVGTSFARYPVFAEHLQRSPAGTYVTSGGLYPHERLVSYRAVDGQPLVVAMAQSTRSILESWRDTVLGAALGLGVLGLLLGTLVAQTLREQRLRDRARQRSLQSEKLEALGRLTANVSHDFSGLVGAMSAGMRLLAAQPADPQRVREAALQTERAVMRGSHLVEQLRAFARRQPLHLRPWNLNRLLESAIELLRQATGEAVELRTQLDAQAADCLLDDAELEVALINLLVNAHDAGARRVLLRTYDTDDRVCLAVQDDGRGMSAEARLQVFEPYFSTKGSRGSGLGLAQVYGFVRQVGGDVSIESHPGEGTTVHLLFPRAAAVPAQGALEAG